MGEETRIAARPAWPLGFEPVRPSRCGNHTRNVVAKTTDFFTAENWKPEYPNPAFRNARPDDTFWAARIISRISDDAVRAVVATAKVTRYSDPMEPSDANALDREFMLTRWGRVQRDPYLA